MFIDKDGDADRKLYPHYYYFHETPVTVYSYRLFLYHQVLPDSINKELRCLDMGDRTEVIMGFTCAFLTNFPSVFNLPTNLLRLLDVERLLNFVAMANDCTTFLRFAEAWSMQPRSGNISITGWSYRRIINEIV